jgi:hypothetical protein
MSRVRKKMRAAQRDYTMYREREGEGERGRGRERERIEK